MKEIKSLTAVRGIAAILVVVFHYIAPFNRDVACISCHIEVLERGYLAVDFFFILSGFIMYLVYERTFKNEPFSSAQGTPAVWRYLWSRFARIYPLHLFTLMMVSAWILWMIFVIGDYTINPRNNTETFIYNLFLIQAWGVYHDVSWNYPSWSISAEMFAYLLFPLFMLVLLKYKYGRAALGLFAVSSLIYFGDDVTALKYDEFGALIRCIQAFALGLSLTAMYSSISKLSTYHLSILQVCSVLLILVLMQMSFLDSYVVLGLALLVMLLAPDRGLVCSMLNTTIIYSLGLYSYSIYMLHALILMMYRDLRASVFEAPSSLGLVYELLLLILLLSVTVISAKYSYQYVELKARNSLNSWLKKSPSKPNNSFENR